MPVEFGIWRVEGDAAVPVATSALANEARLEAIIERDPSILGLGTLFHCWSSGHHWIWDADLTSLRSTPRARCPSRRVGHRERLSFRLSTRLLGFPNSRSTTWLSFTPVITRGDA
jgi:hypothetical protein